MGPYPESAGGVHYSVGPWTLVGFQPQADCLKRPSAGGALANRYDTGRSDLKSSDSRENGQS
jgi:hypothetical protein